MAFPRGFARLFLRYPTPLIILYIPLLCWAFLSLVPIVDAHNTQILSDTQQLSIEPYNKQVVLNSNNGFIFTFNSIQMTQIDTMSLSYSATNSIPLQILPHLKSSDPVVCYLPDGTIAATFTHSDFESDEPKIKLKLIHQDPNSNWGGGIDPKPFRPDPASSTAASAPVSAGSVSASSAEATTGAEPVDDTPPLTSLGAPQLSSLSSLFSVLHCPDIPLYLVNPYDQNTKPMPDELSISFHIQIDFQTELERTPLTLSLSVPTQVTHTLPTLSVVDLSQHGVPWYLSFRVDTYARTNYMVMFADPDEDIYINIAPITTFEEHNMYCSDVFDPNTTASDRAQQMKASGIGAAYLYYTSSNTKSVYSPSHNLRESPQHPELVELPSIPLFGSIVLVSTLSSPLLTQFSPMTGQVHPPRTQPMSIHCSIAFHKPPPALMHLCMDSGSYCQQINIIDSLREYQPRLIPPVPSESPIYRESFVTFTISSPGIRGTINRSNFLTGSPFSVEQDTTIKLSRSVRLDMKGTHSKQFPLIDTPTMPIPYRRTGLAAIPFLLDPTKFVQSPRLFPSNAPPLSDIPLHPDATHSYVPPSDVMTHDTIAINVHTNSDVFQGSVSHILLVTTMTAPQNPFKPVQRKGQTNYNDFPDHVLLFRDVLTDLELSNTSWSWSLYVENSDDYIARVSPSDPAAALNDPHPQVIQTITIQVPPQARSSSRYHQVYPVKMNFYPLSLFFESIIRIEARINNIPLSVLSTFGVNLLEMHELRDQLVVIPNPLLTLTRSGHIDYTHAEVVPSSESNKKEKVASSSPASIDDMDPDTTNENNKGTASNTPQPPSPPLLPNPYTQPIAVKTAKGNKSVIFELSLEQPQPLSGYLFLIKSPIVAFAYNDITAHLLIDNLAQIPLLRQRCATSGIVPIIYSDQCDMYFQWPTSFRTYKTTIKFTFPALGPVGPVFDHLSQNMRHIPADTMFYLRESLQQMIHLTISHPTIRYGAMTSFPIHLNGMFTSIDVEQSTVLPAISNTSLFPHVHIITIPLAQLVQHPNSRFYIPPSSSSPALSLDAIREQLYTHPLSMNLSFDMLVKIYHTYITTIRTLQEQYKFPAEQLLSLYNHQQYTVLYYHITTTLSPFPRVDAKMYPVSTPTPVPNEVLVIGLGFARNPFEHMDDRTMVFHVEELSHLLVNAEQLIIHPHNIHISKPLQGNPHMAESLGYSFQSNVCDFEHTGNMFYHEESGHFTLKHCGFPCGFMCFNGDTCQRNEDCGVDYHCVQGTCKWVPPFFQRDISLLYYRPFDSTILVDPKQHKWRCLDVKGVLTDCDHRQCENVCGQCEIEYRQIYCFSQYAQDIVDNVHCDPTIRPPHLFTRYKECCSAESILWGAQCDEMPVLSDFAITRRHYNGQDSHIYIPPESHSYTFNNVNAIDQLTVTWKFTGNSGTYIQVLLDLNQFYVIPLAALPAVDQQGVVQLNIRGRLSPVRLRAVIVDPTNQYDFYARTQEFGIFARCVDMNQNLCLNEGTCDLVTGHCACPPGSYGEFCEHLYCDELNCDVKGTRRCVDGICSCYHGYFGIECQISPQCDHTLCGSWGYHRLDHSDGNCARECTCLNEWQDTRCQTCGLMCNPQPVNPPSPPTPPPDGDGDGDKDEDGNGDAHTAETHSVSIEQQLRRQLLFHTIFKQHISTPSSVPTPASSRSFITAQHDAVRGTYHPQQRVVTRDHAILQMFGYRVLSLPPALGLALVDIVLDYYRSSADESSPASSFFVSATSSSSLGGHSHSHRVLSDVFSTIQSRVLSYGRSDPSVYEESSHFQTGLYADATLAYLLSLDDQQLQNLRTTYLARIDRGGRVQGIEQHTDALHQITELSNTGATLSGAMHAAATSQQPTSGRRNPQSLSASTNKGGQSRKYTYPHDQYYCQPDLTPSLQDASIFLEKTAQLSPIPLGHRGAPNPNCSVCVCRRGFIGSSCECSLVYGSFTFTTPPTFVREWFRYSGTDQILDLTIPKDIPPLAAIQIEVYLEEIITAISQDLQCLKDHVLPISLIRGKNDSLSIVVGFIVDCIDDVVASAPSPAASVISTSPAVSWRGGDGSNIAIDIQKDEGTPTATALSRAELYTRWHDMYILDYQRSILYATGARRFSGDVAHFDQIFDPICSNDSYLMSITVVSSQSGHGPRHTSLSNNNSGEVASSLPVIDELYKYTSQYSLQMNCPSGMDYLTPHQLCPFPSWAFSAFESMFSILSVALLPAFVLVCLF